MTRRVRTDDVLLGQGEVCYQNKEKNNNLVYSQVLTYGFLATPVASSRKCFRNCLYCPMNMHTRTGRDQSFFASVVEAAQARVATLVVTALV